MDHPGSYKPPPGRIYLATPKKWWKKLDREFHFTLDVAADDEHHMTLAYFTYEQDALGKDWPGTVWCSPPWHRSVLPYWVSKAQVEARRHSGTVVCILPVQPYAKWWKEIVLRHAWEIRYIDGDLAWEPFDGFPFIGIGVEPACLVVFRGPEPHTLIERGYPSR